MCRSDQSPRIKRGFIRPDGLVFWEYARGWREYWVSPGRFASLLSAARRQYQENRGAAIARSRKIRKERPEYRREIERRYRERNRERERERLRAYSENNREKVNATKRASKQRARLDPVKRLADSISSRMRIALNSLGMEKKMKSSEYVGCSWEFLKSYLEARFLPGMTWGNHTLRGWHIDHIIPISSAKTEEDVRRLSHYSNLRPLWAPDNLSKHAKIITILAA